MLQFTYFFSAQIGNAEIVKFLLKKDANFNAIDSLGWNPLEHARVFGHKEVEEILIEISRIGKISGLCFRFYLIEFFRFTAGQKIFKMSRPKKLVKSNKSNSRDFFLTKFHFLQFQKWPKKNQFLN